MENTDNNDALRPTEEQQDPLLQFTSDLTETKVTDKLNRYNSSWDQYSQDLYPKMKTWWNSYRNLEYSIEGVSTKIPEIFTTIETELPHLLNSIYGPSNIVDAKAKFVDPQEEKAFKVKAYINKLIKDICKGRKKTELIIKNMLIYGWAVSKVYWNVKPDKDIDPITKEVVNQNSAHPDFYMVDPFAFAWDPDYDQQEIDGIPWVRERVFISKNKMKEMRDSGECAKFDDQDLSTVAEDQGKESRGTRNDSTMKTSKTYYDEFWCTMYSKDEEGKTFSKEYRIWFLANKKVIKFEENLYGYKPFTICRAYSQPNEFLGAGEPEVIGAIANQLSYTHYQAGKTVKKLGQSLTYIDPSAGISPQNLKRIEQGVLFVNNLNGIKSEQTTDPQNISVLVQYEQHLETVLEKITGVGPTMQGEIVGDVTATQISIVSQAASNRLASKLTHLQEDFIVPLAEMFFLLNKQLLQIPIQFFDTNNNLIQLSPDDFNGNYIWTAGGMIGQSNKSLQLAQNNEIIKGLIEASQASLSTPNPFTVNLPHAIETYILPYTSMPSSSELIVRQPVQMPNTQEGLPPKPNLTSEIPIEQPLIGNVLRPKPII